MSDGRGARQQVVVIEESAPMNDKLLESMASIQPDIIESPWVDTHCSADRCGFWGEANHLANERVHTCTPEEMGLANASWHRREIDQGYPENQAVETWGDGETYGCSVIKTRENAIDHYYPGGWYCGYVRFKHPPIIRLDTAHLGPLDHANAHGGITYAEQYDDGSVVYGFDCAHFFDAHQEYSLEQIKDWVEELRQSIEIIGAHVRQEVEHAEPTG